MVNKMVIRTLIYIKKNVGERSRDKRKSRKETQIELLNEAKNAFENFLQHEWI